jgi:16S rRNA (guanine527-N7)-methyltransferase
VTEEQRVKRLRSRASSHGITLSQDHARQLSEYAALLERWNQRINLTSLSLAGLPDEAMDRLLLEPVVAAGAVQRGTRDWIDVGSGSGSPAIPMKILQPELRLTLVESRSRKAAFLREAVRQLELHDADVLEARLEKLGETREPFADLVTSRGVRLDETVLDAVERTLKPGGNLFVFGLREASPRLGPFVRVGSRALPGRGGALAVFQRKIL